MKISTRRGVARKPRAAGTGPARSRKPGLARPEDHPDWPALAPRQREAIQTAWVERRPLTLLGAAGTGKSKVNAILSALGATVTAATAIAACAIGMPNVKTTHSTLGIFPTDLAPPLPTGRANDEDEARRVAEALTKWCARRNHFRLAARLAKMKARVFVMDEFCTTGSGMAALLDAVFRKAVSCMKAEKRMALGLDPDSPFGGVCMVFVGDYAQLEPVKDAPFFESNAYRTLFDAGGAGKTLMLVDNFRQRNHSVLIHTLNCIRNAHMTPAAWAMLAVLEDRAERLPSCCTTELHATNASVRKANNERISAARLRSSPSRGYWKHETDGQPLVPGMRLTPDGPCIASIEYDADSRNWTEVANIQLAIGAPVRITCNLPRHKKYGPAVNNGTQGRIIGKRGDGPDAKAVVLINGGYRRVIFPVETCYRTIILNDGKRITDALMQLPVRTAYGMTVHGVQGVTMLSATIKFNADWVPWGQMYVALSRVGSERNMIVHGAIEAAQKLSWPIWVQRVVELTGFDVAAERRRLDEESDRLCPQFRALLQSEGGIDTHGDGRADRILQRLASLGVETSLLNI